LIDNNYIKYLRIKMNRFDNKVVMVTGAGSGIGMACALRLGEEGASIVALDVNQEGLDDLSAQLAALDISHAVRLCDISSEQAVSEAVAACVEKFKQLDVLVHMAGMLRFDLTHDLTLTNWQRVMDVNITGTFLLAKAVLPHLIETQGNIVNAASTAALSGLPNGAAYSASKGAVLAFTRSIAVEYAKRGVRANCICPGDIKTNMTAKVDFPDGMDHALLTRAMSITGPKGTETVAGVVAMLASIDGVHITGEDIRIDGGTLS
jgi:NAD(P)-dependent dehydrogenase (short-subunit alcohol dehydrogenase family)